MSGYARWMPVACTQPPPGWSRRSRNSGSAYSFHTDVGLDHVPVGVDDLGSRALFGHASLPHPVVFRLHPCTTGASAWHGGTGCRRRPAAFRTVGTGGRDADDHTVGVAHPGRRPRGRRQPPPGAGRGAGRRAGLGDAARAAWSPRSCPCSATRDGVWIGWSGQCGRRPVAAPRARGHRAARRCRSARTSTTTSTSGSPTRRCGRCTTTRSGTPSFDRRWWQAYVAVNHRFADAAADGGRRRARRSGCTTTSCSSCRRCCASCGPTCGSASSCTSRSRRSELFVQLPWRREILEGLLGADLVGLPGPGRGVELRPPAPGGSRGATTADGGTSTLDGRRVRVGAFPISIDAAELSRRGAAIPTCQARAARSAPTSATRSSCSSASTGSTTRRASTGGSARSASCSTKARSTPARHVMVQIAVPSRERGRALPARARAARAARRRGQRRARDASAHPPIHYLHQSARRPTSSSRCTSPPTSCSSPRCATA